MENDSTVAVPPKTKMKMKMMMKMKMKMKMKLAGKKLIIVGELIIKQAQV